MAHITWRKEFSVNVALIDEQHKHFLAILDEVYDCFDSMLSANETRAIIEKLTAHVEEHFTTEEKYFDEFHYDGIDEQEHREKHQIFRDQVADLKERYESGQTDLVTEMADLMENWLIQHIMTYDKKYSACFNEHGLN